MTYMFPMKIKIHKINCKIYTQQSNISTIEYNFISCEQINRNQVDDIFQITIGRHMKENGHH